MQWKQFVSASFALCVLLFGAVVVPAQTTTGTIYGTVADSTGALIPNATVIVTNVATGATAIRVSNGSGEYTFPALDPGNYTVAAKVTGFQSVTKQGISLSSNQNVHTDFALQIGSTDISVTVDADTTLVDTREAQLAETIDQRQIAELPLINRDSYDLVTLVPGVTDYTPDSQIGSRGGTTFSVNGLSPNSVSTYLDGTLDTAIYLNGANILPNPDALQEFRLLTSTFDAEFGRSPGGALNVITKSGTASFHGGAYEYLRNTIFNAQPYFNSPGTAPTPFHQNQFGAFVGGPVPLGRQHTFFFLSYEKLIDHTPATTAANEITTATALERAGNFTASPASVKAAIAKVGPLSTAANCTTPNAYIICPRANVIATATVPNPAALDPVAQNALQYVPVEAANYAGTLNTNNPADAASAIVSQQIAEANTTADQGLARIDFQVTPAHQMEAMFFNSRGNQDTPKVGASKILDYGNFTNYENQVNAVISDAWTISSNTLNSLRGFYEQNRYAINNLHQGQFLSDLGSAAGEGGPIYGVPQFAVTGYWTQGTQGQGPSNILQQTFGLVDTANLTRGRHNIKLGGSLFYSKYGEAGGQYSNGVFTFSGGVTGNALADFLEGRPNSVRQTSSQLHKSHNYDPSVFVQDDWQVTTRLSLNAGVRWELYSPFTGDPVLGTFIPGQQSTVIPSAPIGLNYENDKNVPDGIYNIPLDTFAPRLGFAYDLFGDGKTSLRGGIGIFYDEQRELLTGNLQQTPYVLDLTTTRPPCLTYPYSPANGKSVVTCSSATEKDPFPYAFNPTAPIFPTALATNGTRPNGGSIPYAEEYNLTLEQQLGKSFGMRVAYVGSSSRKGYTLHDINAPTPGPVPTTTHALDLRRPYEPYIASGGFEFGMINIYDPALNGNYNSLQTTIRGRVSRSLNVFASYVFSKALDYEGPYPNGNDIHDNYGPAATDQRNTFTASYIYEFPSVKFWGLFGTEVLSGWQLNGVTLIHSGTPFTVTSGVDTNGDGLVNDRVNVISNPYLPGGSRRSKIYGYLNPAAFATPTTPYGNESNNEITSPRFTETNLSIFKEFAVHNEMRFQFRAEAENIIGNVNLGAPAANLKTLVTDESTTAPKPIISTQVGTPRLIQLALKFLF